MPRTIKNSSIKADEKSKEISSANFYKEERDSNVYKQSKTEQGSALGGITEIKRERKLLNSCFLTNILSNVSQNTG